MRMRKFAGFALMAITGSLCLSFANVQGVQAQKSESIENQMVVDTVEIGGGGFVSGIVTGQKVMYARTDVGGAYRYNFETEKWEQMLGFLNETDRGLLSVDAMCVDPTDDNKVYLLCGCAYFSDAKTVIFRSEDGGNSFEEVDVTSLIQVHGNGNGRQFGESIAIDPDQPNVLYCGGDTTGLIMSEDYGKSWSLVKGYEALNLFKEEINWPTWTNHKVKTTAKEYYEANGIGTVAISNGKVYVGTSVKGEANVHVAEVGSDNFEVLSADLPTDYLPSRINLDADGNLLISYVNGITFDGSAGAAYRYNVTTGELTDISPRPKDSAVGIGSVVSDPTDSNRLLATTCGLWWGQCWEEDSWEKNTVCYGDVTFKSEDGGATWTSMLPGEKVGWPGTLATNYLQDGGHSWIRNKAVHWSGSIVFDPTDTKRFFVTSGNGVFACDDVWADVPTIYFHPDGIEEVVSLDGTSTPDGTFYSVIGDYDGFKHTSEGAVQYSPTMDTIAQNSSCGAIAYCPTNPDVMVRYSESGNGAFYSLDGGDSWTELKSTYSGGKAAILQLDGDTYRIFRTGSGKISYTDDFGASWQECSGTKGSSNLWVCVDEENSQYVYAYGYYYNQYYNGSSDGKKPTIDDAQYILMVSDDYGKTFKSQTVCLYDQCDNAYRIAYLKEGTFALAAGWNGAYLVTDYGANVEKLDSVFYCKTIGYGAAQISGNPYTLYMWGKPDEEDTEGIYRSTDMGSTWVAVDTNMTYGGTGNGNYIVGDMEDFGTFYMSTVGCGIVRGRLTGGETDPKPIEVTGITLKESATVEEGKTVTLTATVTPANATNKKVTWSSDDETVATVKGGVVTGVKEGTAKITAMAGGKEAVCTVTVTKVEQEPEVILVTGVSLSEEKVSLKENETITLAVTVEPENATDQTVTWSSDDETVAKVKNGVVTGVKEGTAKITAMAGGKEAVCTVTVTKVEQEPEVIPVTGIRLDNENATIVEGNSVKLAATVEPENATDQTVTWSSSDKTVATVSESGKVTAVKEGTAIITAKAGDKTAICTITVEKVTNSEQNPDPEKVMVTGVSIDNAKINLTVGEDTNLKATVIPKDADNQKVSWESSDKTIISVTDKENGNAVLTAKKEGTAIITVITEDGGFKASCRVTVTKQVVNVTSVELDTETLALTEGSGQKLSAMVFPTSADNQNVSWSSSDESVASVDASGRVTARKEGKATITVTTEDGAKTATCEVTVEKKAEDVVHVTDVTIRAESETIKAGGTTKVIGTVMPADAANKEVDYISSDESIATVSADGIVTGMKAGSVTITVYARELDAQGKDIKASVEITIEKNEEPVEAVTLSSVAEKMILGGEKLKLTATITPANATVKDVIWESTKPSVAVVSNTGEVTAISGGTAYISVTTVDGNMTALCKVTVEVPIEGITMNPDSAELVVGQTMKFSAEVRPNDATNQTILWSSKTPHIASVDKYGTVTALSAGTAIIKATSVSDEQKYAECKMVVKNAELPKDTDFLLAWSDVKFDKKSEWSQIDDENGTAKEFSDSNLTTSRAPEKDFKVTANVAIPGVKDVKPDFDGSIKVQAAIRLGENWNWVSSMIIAELAANSFKWDEKSECYVAPIEIQFGDTVKAFYGDFNGETSFEEAVKDKVNAVTLTCAGYKCDYEGNIYVADLALEGVKEVDTPNSGDEGNTENPGNSGNQNTTENPGNSENQNNTGNPDNIGIQPQPDAGSQSGNETSNIENQQAIEEAKKDTVSLAESEAILNQTNTDKKDPADSVFAKLRLKAEGKKKSVKLSWTKVNEAEGYLIYGAVCGQKMKLITMVDGSKKTYTVKNLKAGKYYKYVVKAYKTVAGEQRVITTSKSAHTVTDGGKYGNPTKITVKSGTIKLKTGKTTTLQPKLTVKKTVKTHIAKFRYESDNKEIATVNSKGKVKAVKTGSCNIYIYAQNGIYKKVKIKVQ